MKKLKQKPGVFLRHEACLTCGSQDNRAIYQNDGVLSYYCFGCDDSGFINEDINKEEDEYMKVEKETVEDILDFPVRGFKERNITKTIAELYNVKIGYGEDGQDIKYHYYPITNNSKTVGYERRDVKNKNFTAIGSVKNNNELFGQSLFPKGSGLKIVVTEGMLDAMSIQQVYKLEDKEYPVVSVINGAQNAAKQVIANLDYLNSFTEVIFAFDDDEPGRDGAEACAKILRTGKAKIASFSRFGKDASDYLVKGKIYELKKALWDAEDYSPAGIISSADTLNLFLEDKREDSIPYPDCFGEVNKMTFGRRTGELTIFTAGTGSGKSSFIREDIYHVLQTTDIKIGIVSLEESIRETLDGIIGLHLDKRINLPDTPFDRTGDEGTNAWKEVAGDGRLTLLDHQGSLSDDSLIDKIEFMAASGCKFIYLDHITIAVSEVDGNTNEAMDKVMSDLLKLCKKHDIWVGVVSHLRKTGKGKTYEEGADLTEDALKGSGSLKQIAFQIIGFTRNKYAEEEFERSKVKISVLKNRFSGFTGPAGYARFNSESGRLMNVPSEFEDSEGVEFN